MISQLRYLNVNWIDGMKLNKNHFIQSENALLDRVKDSTALSLNQYNYGLIPPAPGTDAFFTLTCEVDRANLLRISVLECRAVTPGGARIEITTASRIEGQANTKEVKGEYNIATTFGKTLYVVISVNPFGKVPAGEPNPEENPPRYPFSDFEYNLNILPVEEVKMYENGAYHITLGKLKVTNSGALEVVDTYIPPCTSVSGSPELIELFDEQKKNLADIEKYAGEIIKKILTKKHQNEVLVSSVHSLSGNIFNFLSANITEFRWWGAELPPVFMVGFFVNFARLVKNTIEVHTVNGKEVMLTYFRDWVIELKQGEFEDVLDNLVNLSYDHMDIYESISKLKAFSEMITTVFRKMSTLDYIGDKKEADRLIVTKNEAILKTPVKKGGFLIGPPK